MFKNLVFPMWAPRREQISVSEIRVPNKNIRVILVIRVQKNTECDPCAKNIFVLSEIFMFKKIHGDIRVQKSRVPHVSAPPRTKIREIGEIRVQDKNIRVIRVITSLRSVGLRRISCSKEYTKGYALNWVLTKYILNDK